jgi:phosphoribosylformylglycinamidine (FGAM) synthase-like enzyme
VTGETQAVNFLTLDSDGLVRLSKERGLSLNAEEMGTIQRYFRTQGRSPSDPELETLAQTWSEHCKHKTFRAAVHHVDEDAAGVQTEKNYQDLLKETIVKVTDELRKPWCLSVFKDNAGIVDADWADGESGPQALAFKVETHNHPSALEPYGGAGTGLGGVIRDVLGAGLGAKPIANTDVFCFGPVEEGEKKTGSGLSTRRIVEGVVSGVRDYGNRMGIPTVNGAVVFDPDFKENPLVFCGTLGLIPQSAIAKEVRSGDLIVMTGGRVGRDGIHGATFSSDALTTGIPSSVVQIGNPIVQKKMMDILLRARDKGLYRGITDCGAGGLSSAVGEMGEKTGARVHLERVPLKYDGIAPWEIWLSESQERMVLAVPPEKWAEVKKTFRRRRRGLFRHRHVHRGRTASRETRPPGVGGHGHGLFARRSSQTVHGIPMGPAPGRFFSSSGNKKGGRDRIVLVGRVGATHGGVERMGGAPIRSRGSGADGGKTVCGARGRGPVGRGGSSAVAAR